VGAGLADWNPVLTTLFSDVQVFREVFMRDEVAKSYLEAHYSLKHRFVAGVSRLFEQRVYTVRHGPLRGLRRKGGLGFLPQWAVGRTDDTAEARLFTSPVGRGRRLSAAKAPGEGVRIT